nr:MAG TPA: hypothetical protein [Caudoviricetes sp.]
MKSQLVRMTRTSKHPLRCNHLASTRQALKSLTSLSYHTCFILSSMIYFV